MITFSSRGDFKKTQKFLAYIKSGDLYSTAVAQAKLGVNALSAATPVDSGETATSWNYEVKNERGALTITWTNTHIVDGVPIAIILQYGHGTGTGGWVQGRNYINPAIKPVFDLIAETVWKAVKSA